jgi:N-acetyl sugar amidotransferase
MICSVCIMDSSDPDIIFDEKGQCKHCRDYFIMLEKNKNLVNEYKLNVVLHNVKKSGQKNKYDCVIGLSGGVDSSYLAFLVKELGLRPLAVHLDNGWDSELAVANIERIVNILDIDLYTHVIDWEEFKDIQKSFLEASIPGMEIPTDHAIWAILQLAAAKHNIKYIINGYNASTEYIMARSWSEGDGQLDWLLIRNIQKKFGKRKFKSFPHVGLMRQIYVKLIKRVKTVYLLDYVNYSKKDAIKVLEERFGWVNYGGKHYESIYTRFTQGYIQPLKFRFDKRRAHLSNLICKGEMSRHEALLKINLSPYESFELLENDIKYFKSKLGLSDGEYERLLSLKIKSFKEYIGYHNHFFFRHLYGVAIRINNLLKKIDFI